MSDLNPPTDSYAAHVYRAYLGEVYGEAMYTTIAMAQTDARRRAAWLTMVDLEVAMRERLVSTVERLGGDPSSIESSGELDRWRAAGRAEGVDYTRMPWSEMIVRFERELGDDVERYRALERGCPVTDAETLSMLTEHEVVAQEFARRELSGATSTSLDPARQLIARLRSSPAGRR